MSIFKAIITDLDVRWGQRWQVPPHFHVTMILKFQVIFYKEHISQLKLFEG